MKRPPRWRSRAPTTSTHAMTTAIAIYARRTAQFSDDMQDARSSTTAVIPQPHSSTAAGKRQYQRIQIMKRFLFHPRADVPTIPQPWRARRSLASRATSSNSIAALMEGASSARRIDPQADRSSADARDSSPALWSRPATRTSSGDRHSAISAGVILPPRRQGATRQRLPAAEGITIVVPRSVVAWTAEHPLAAQGAAAVSCRLS